MAKVPTSVPKPSLEKNSYNLKTSTMVSIEMKDTMVKFLENLTPAPHRAHFNYRKTSVNSKLHGNCYVIGRFVGKSRFGEKNVVRSTGRGQRQTNGKPTANSSF